MVGSFGATGLLEAVTRSYHFKVAADAATVSTHDPYDFMRGIWILLRYFALREFQFEDDTGRRERH
jgi:hypothetical protein